MSVQNIDILYKKIVSCAKEYGMMYPDGLQMKRLMDDKGEIYFVRDIPAAFNKLVVDITKDIVELDNHNLKKLEDKLLHVPEERGFNSSQIILLNEVRSVVFLEQENRRNPKPIEPGE